MLIRLLSVTLTAIEMLPLTDETEETEETAPKLPWERELTFSPAELRDWRRQLDDQLDQIAKPRRSFSWANSTGWSFGTIPILQSEFSLLT
jgi:hypothetical protein